MYYIWFHNLKDGEIVGGGVWNFNGYTYKQNAVRAAKKRFADTSKFEWIVAKENPFVTQ